MAPNYFNELNGPAVKLAKIRENEKKSADDLMIGNQNFLSWETSRRYIFAEATL